MRLGEISDLCGLKRYNFTWISMGAAKSALIGETFPVMLADSLYVSGDGQC